jgi:secondary thiamine-phosphate synthase enzyme
MFTISTLKKHELIDITSKIETEVAKVNVESGLISIFIPHASAALIINENDDPNICIDFIQALSQLVPEHGNYLHDRIDGNAAAHIKASLLRPDITLHIDKGRLVLGRWQAIMLAEFDGPRERKVLTKIIKG